MGKDPAESIDPGGEDTGPVADIASVEDAVVAAEDSPLDRGVPIDAPVSIDAPFSIDAPVPLDVPVPIDAPVPLDVPVPIDVPTPVDVPVPVDVPPVGDVSVVDTGPPDAGARVCPTSLALGLFDTGTDGWVFDGLWRQGSGGMVAGSTTRFSSAYTQNLTSGSDADLSACSAAQLTFMVRLDDDPAYASSVDRSERLSPQCSGDSGASWTSLTPNPWPAHQSPCASTYCSGGVGTSRAFSLTAQSIALPAACLTSRVRVRFEARGASVWRLQNPGWTIDAVRLN